MSGRRRFVLNLVFYQIAWFACVLGAAYGTPQVGLAATALAFGVALAVADRPRSIALLAVAGVIVGGVLETALVANGRVAYASPGAEPSLPPLWMLALWVGFAINANELLGWIHGRIGLQVLLALVGAPLAYLAGEKLGAMTFLDPRVTGVIVLGALWSVAFPLLMEFARRVR